MDKEISEWEKLKEEGPGKKNITFMVLIQIYDLKSSLVEIWDMVEISNDISVALFVCNFQLKWKLCI